MEFTCKSYRALCHLCTFEINGIKADENDFVDSYDHSPETAEPYGCGDMRADIVNPTDTVLKKYNITLSEYYEIAEKVSEEISFGSCGWCV